MATPQPQKSDSPANERRAKLLEAIGQRLMEVHANAHRSHLALQATAKAVLADEKETASHSDMLGQIELSLYYPPSPFQKCEGFLKQAAADARAGDNLGSARQFADFENCLMHAFI
jgi:hypothetical protein